MPKFETDSARSIAVEDYLLTIYRLEANEAPVKTMVLAEHLGVTAASISGMLRKLQRIGLVNHEPYYGVVLTLSGRAEALRLLRYHRLWEVFLSEVLELPDDQIHAEAHRLEHATSDDVAERLAGFLGQPETSPEGRPIPAPQGTLPGTDH
jgi:DtxR family Mn-dependent transcriptional regulator